MESYIKLMTLLTVSSFPLFALNYIGHFGFQVNAPKVKSLILYTSYDMPRELLRNSGMFWEPGAFAGYLLIALMFIAAINKAFIVGKYTKEVVVISFGVLSTLSTMGFMVYGLILFLYAMHRYKWGKIVLVPVIAVITYFGYSQLAFMSEKVSVQFEEALQMSRFDVSNTRFGSLIMDAQYISAEPLFGNGLNPATRFRFHPFINADLGHGNGMSNFMACWGVPLFAFWCFKSYKWFFVNTRSTFVSGMLLLLALLSLQGEQFLNFPLFLSFFSLADADSSI